MIYILLSCHKIIQNKAYNLKILCDFFFRFNEVRENRVEGGSLSESRPPCEGLHNNWYCER